MFISEGKSSPLPRRNDASHETTAWAIYPTVAICIKVFLGRGIKDCRISRPMKALSTAWGGRRFSFRTPCFCCSAFSGSESVCANRCNWGFYELLMGDRLPWLSHVSSLRPTCWLTLSAPVCSCSTCHVNSKISSLYGKILLVFWSLILVQSLNLFS